MHYVLDYVTLATELVGDVEVVSRCDLSTGLPFFNFIKHWLY